MGLVSLSTRYPWTTVAIGIALAVGSIGLCMARLEYHTSRAALIGNQNEFQQAWLEYTKEFGDKEDAVIVVEGKSREQVVPAMKDLAARVAQETKYFRSVLDDEVDLSGVYAKGLFYVPLAALEEIDRSLEAMAPILRDWSNFGPGALKSSLPPPATGTGRAAAPGAANMASLQEHLAPMCAMLTAAFGPGKEYLSPWPDKLDLQRLTADLAKQMARKPKGRFGFVVLKLVEEKATGMAENCEAIAALRRIVNETKPRYPEVTIGLTGFPVMENDEMQSSQSAGTVATILSYLGVFLVLVIGFGGVRHSLWAMAALVVGMIWSLGYTTLAVGHLNILSSAFGAILTGLGINYSIYYVAQYLQLRKAGYATPQALVGTAGTVGAGITIGAAGTAIAFFMSGFTEFKGVAELGVVAGGGIVACWLAAMTVLPGALRLCDARRAAEKLPTPLGFHHWIEPILARPKTYLFSSVAATIVLALASRCCDTITTCSTCSRPGLESVEIEEKVLAQNNESTYFALSVANSPQEALEKKAQFLKLASVDHVDELASLLPPDLERKRPIIERIGRRLANLPAQAPPIPVPPQDQLVALLFQVRTLLVASPPMAPLAERLAALGQTVGDARPEEYHARLSGVLQRAADELLEKLGMLRFAANPQPPAWSDLPQSLVDRFIGKSGKLLLRVYGKGDLWDVASTEAFVREIRSVDPKTTGNPIQISESSRVMKQSYEQAAIYAIAIILPVVFFDCGNFRDTLLAVLPLGLGMVQLFGLMGLLNVPLNPANTIALPLMLGMGVDNGVHVIHDFRLQRGRYRMSHSTSVAVVLNTLTTMVGFAVLMVCDHRGLQSLGKVLTLGMAFCLFSSLVILPPLLVVMTGRRREEDLSEFELP